MLNRGSFLLIAIIVLLLILTSWYAASLSQIVPLLGATLTNIGSLQEGAIVQTSATGSVAYQGTVVSATQAGNGDVIFSGLQLVNLSQSGPPWTLTSPSGTTSEHNNFIELTGGVHLSRPADAKNPAVQVETETASIEPNTQIVHGDGLITFTEPGTQNETQGVGFKANMQAKLINLLSQVESTYSSQKILPLHVTSREASVNLEQGVATYKGDVVAVQGVRKLNSNTLSVNRDKSGAIDSFVAKGDPAKTEDQPNPKSGMAYGQARSIYYYPGQALVKYVDQARFTQGGNVFEGDELVYNITTQVVESPKVPHGSGTTTIILPPYSEQKKETP